MLEMDKDFILLKNGNSHTHTHTQYSSITKLLLIVLLIICVNLLGLKEAQIAGKTLFLAVSARLFPEEVSV